MTTWFHKKLKFRKIILCSACCCLGLIINPVLSNAVFAQDPDPVDSADTDSEDDECITAEGLDKEFINHQQWMTNTFWDGNLVPALRAMSNQLSALSMHQVEIVGTFFDAKHQLETQKSLQKLRLQTHKDYHPSHSLCEIGSSMISLAAAERKAEVNAHVMSQRSQDRHLGQANTVAALGLSGDLKNRLEQFRQQFCDPKDFFGNFGNSALTTSNAGALSQLCANAGPSGVGATIGGPWDRGNKDIDYAASIESPWTINVDFSDETYTRNEEDVFALANNLYGHKVFTRFASSQNLNSLNAQSALLDARALLAKRSVAENSYNSIASMKSVGTIGSRQFLEAVLFSLGVRDDNGDLNNPDDILRTLGVNEYNDKIGPSYYAQMEILTKKLLQRPDFYTNLYDKPVNVERKQAALQAIELMQKFDTYNSYLRNEMNLSMLVELSLTDKERTIQNKLNSQ